MPDMRLCALHLLFLQVECVFYIKTVDFQRLYPCSYPVSAANKIPQHTIQGGDRYPQDGTNQSDHALSQDRSRQERTCTACFRRTYSCSKPKAEGAELPHQSKAGTSGCGHRNCKGQTAIRNRKEDHRQSVLFTESKIVIPIFKVGCRQKTSG